MSTVEATLQQKDTRIKVIIVVAIALVIIIGALLGKTVFRSPLPNYAAAATSVQSLSVDDRKYVDSVAEEVDFNEPLTFPEKEQLVLGAAWKVCQDASGVPYTEHPSLHFLAMQGWLFGLFSETDSSRKESFVTQSLERFC